MHIAACGSFAGPLLIRMYSQEGASDVSILQQKLEMAMKEIERLKLNSPSPASTPNAAKKISTPSTAPPSTKADSSPPEVHVM